MNELRDHQQEALSAKLALSEAEQNLHDRRNRLRYIQNQLTNTQRLGEVGNPTADRLRLEILEVESQIIKDNNLVSNDRANLDRVLGEFPKLDQPWDLVEQLPDNLPFLLFPVRIETRFMTVNNANGNVSKELWVRIFPDDIAAHTHEQTLTLDEIKASRTYWREIWTANREDKAERSKIIKGAWRTLIEAFGGTRAAWIVRETKPKTLDVNNADDLEFPEFNPETLKEESWSQAPQSSIMPDQFVVMAYSGEKEIIRIKGNLIPNPLPLGPDPQKAEDEYQQQDGELLVGEDIEWIYDFDKAVDVGMGLKIPLSPPFDTNGFDRLLVLGLRLSSDESENQSLLEELFENHHYAPDGMSLLPQGTPTNNTDSKGSGFSSQDLSAEISYSIENGDSLFEPSNEQLQQKDGQRLADALGINYQSFEHIQNADKRDVGEALAINKSLWHGTLGYYLEEMLEFNQTNVGLTREFFTDNVTGRGPLPAIRIGSQPYGILLTSDFSQWQWSPKIDGDRFPFLNRLHKEATNLEDKWQDLAPNVAHVGAPGDPYQNLLSMMGLHASSVEHYRRHAVGKQYIWNLEAYRGGTFVGSEAMASLDEQASALLQELNFDFEETPNLFDLSFFRAHNKVTDPLVDDIFEDEIEKFSETKQLKSSYKNPDPNAKAEDDNLETNYIGWLLHSSFDDIKAQHFVDLNGESLPTPRPLLYRMLRGALLQAFYDTTMQLYTNFELIDPSARRELELSNIGADRTVTRWEFMDADISLVLPEINSQEGLSVGRFLQTDDGLSLPEALGLREVRECLKILIKVPTARLERIFAEHLDLCSYRLDAWQMGCFNRRLQQQRFPVDREVESPVPGIYLGAFGWVEDLHPVELVPVEPESTPPSLHNPEHDGPLYKQEDNAGFIHGPSLNHAVTAAVLRNAYITHLDPDDLEKMAVNLSSERVRTALDFLEGIRSGQELGALLGYQFERGLHDRHEDSSLNQYIPSIRQKYPLVADKITEGAAGEQIESKEARNVFDGYAFLEAAFLKEVPLEYPYAIDGLPTDEESAHALAIKAEVGRMADTLDAIKDLALAESVYQMTQGNFDRAGAMLKSFTEGNNPIEPEIARTPQSGTALVQRVTLHLESHDLESVDINPSPWSEIFSIRAKIELNLNKWLGDILPLPENILYTVQFGDATAKPRNLANLGLQPIDLIYMIGDDLSNEATELEERIAYKSRSEAEDDTLLVKINFMDQISDPEVAFNPDTVTLFELLPLLRHLRDLVTGCRPLAADDFTLPSETSSDEERDLNPKGYDLSELSPRVEIAFIAFKEDVDALNNTISNPTDVSGLRNTLFSLANFGIQDAFPHSSFGASNEAKAILISQALGIQKNVNQQLIKAEELINAGKDVDNKLTAEEKAARLREAAKEIFGPAFNLIPVFNLKNKNELQAAVDFRDADADSNLTRHHRDNPYIVTEWLQGVARVREKIGTLESVNIYAEILKRNSLELKPLQLPFREQDYWVAVSYPEVEPEDIDKPNVFIPDGNFLSLVQWLPTSGFNTEQPQSGLLLDENNELIPGKHQITGIAIHYNQPTTEPPQALLLAITPEVTGAWNWEKLVGTLNNTLDRAKLRAVEPDHLDSSALGHLLPAIISAVTSFPFATISTDFVHKTAENQSNFNTDNE